MAKTVHTGTKISMDGVFMKKITKLILTCLLLVTAFWLGTVASDKAILSQDLIRLHVVADSDSAEDQQIKLKDRKSTRLNSSH